MLFKIVLWLSLCLAWLTVGCTAQPQPSSNDALPTEESTTTAPIVITSAQPNRELTSLIAQALDLSPDSIQVQKTTTIDWPDSCLGMPRPEELCAQIIVPGFKATVQTPKGIYRANGDRTQKNLRLQPAP